MSGKARPSLRVKTLLNVDYSNLSITDKNCIHEVFDRFENMVNVVRCKDCKWFNEIGCAISIVDDSDKPKEDDFCSFGERKDSAE